MLDRNEVDMSTENRKSNEILVLYTQASILLLVPLLPSSLVSLLVSSLLDFSVCVKIGDIQNH